MTIFFNVHNKILVLKKDYDKNPFYGLNQLPKFLNVYSDKFYYEIRFLKAYLNNYLNEIETSTNKLVNLSKKIENIKIEEN